MHMIADFLAAVLVMLVIIAVGLLVGIRAQGNVARGCCGSPSSTECRKRRAPRGSCAWRDLPSMSELLSRSIFWITWCGLHPDRVSVLGVAGLQEQISRLFRFLPELFVAMLIFFSGW